MSSDHFPYKLTLSSEPWDKYVQYLRNNIFKEDTNPKDKTATLIRCADEKTLELMKKLCNPIDPYDRSFEALVYLVGDHLDRLKQREIIRARKMFYGCNQQVGQTVKTFAATLERLIDRCYFQQSLELDILKKKLILGLSNVEHRDKLCDSFSDMTYNEAVDIAADMERKEIKDRLKIRHRYRHDEPITFPIIGPRVIVERVEQLSDLGPEPPNYNKRRY